MRSQEIRSSFLEFFAARGHRIVPSSPVIPYGDPTLLFTNAGMNQFKDVFLGTGTREYTRAANTQKCIRVSGKHNDLEQVGYDTYHHTFFEMLGNWSFGDYYKAEAIAWAWELLTQVWRLPPERLYATVHYTDEEAYTLWQRHLPDSHILRFGDKDNFWEMGETGPCGPCTEIHYDRTPDLRGGALVNAGTQDVIEIWNNVFIQYNRTAEGTLEELPRKHVDTGMGLERITAVLQGKDSNYDTDLFVPLIAALEELSGKRYVGDLHVPEGVAMRVMADHIRALAFAIADGALPGNEGRGYVLRRILRRAVRYGRNLGFDQPVLYRLVPVLVDIMGDPFPELRQHQTTIERVIRAEEEMFLETLDRGIERFAAIAAQTKARGESILRGEDAFLLYDSFGFPLDLTELMAREEGLTVDREGFERCMAQQRERSRQAQKRYHAEVITHALDVASEFVGYDTLETESRILAVEDNTIVLAATPFYVEAGGQVSDTGTIEVDGLVLQVTDVQRNGNAIVHVCESAVPANIVGQKAVARVDAERRWSIQRNHTATHLVHEALRRVLGEHVKQSGSLVAPDRLRFDFSHFAKLSPSELAAVEQMVNEKILERIPVETRVLPIEEARRIPGVKMFFGDKYGDIVRVVIVDETFSAEFCGGTHVRNTSEIGLFALTDESAIAAGVRRIEAVTGRGLATYIEHLRQRIEQGTDREAALNDRVRSLERELEKLRMEQTMATLLPALLSGARMVGAIRVVTGTVEVPSLEHLRMIAESLRQRMKSGGIGLLAAVLDGKAQLVCVVTDDLASDYPAGKLVAKVADQLGGKGGGRPTLATAGARDVEKLDAALAEFPLLLEQWVPQD
ncbi:MAG: alanine--tRNA ligase [Bacteroidota bacterium]|nr:alanine--tRNA ligase [Candidatus Kapabacteria bacterium]MDW8271533.1 alanine--tRNA ligase [Bacteroidota bacterium]